MSRIFICYRREDSSGITGRIYDRLAHQLGSSNIIMDIDNVEPGIDFVEAIENEVGTCDALIAVIGKKWLRNGREKKSLLENNKDYVRLELAHALSRNIRVIPVLVEGANLPLDDDLPIDLKPILRRNAIKVQHESFDAGAEQLIVSLKKLLGEKMIQSNDKGSQQVVKKPREIPTIQEAIASSSSNDLTWPKRIISGIALFLVWSTAMVLVQTLRYGGVPYNFLTYLLAFGILSGIAGMMIGFHKRRATSILFFLLAEAIVYFFLPITLLINLTLSVAMIIVAIILSQKYK